MKHKIFIFALLAGLGFASVGQAIANAATQSALSVFTSANKVNTEQTISLTALASSHLGAAVSSISIDFGGTKETCKNAYYCQLTAGPFEKKGNVKYTVEAKMKLANGKETRTVKKGVIVVVPASAVIKNKVATPAALSVFTSTNKIDTQQTVDMTALAASQTGGTVASIKIDIGGNKQTCENLYFCQLTAGPFEKKGKVKYTVEAKMKSAKGKEAKIVKKGVIMVIAAKKAAVSVKPPASGQPAAESSAANNSAATQPVDTSSGTQSTDASVADGANYTGPFPAPEGMVLTGFTGEDKFYIPTGNGTYRFSFQTEWKKPIACQDKTRTMSGSKGKTFEEGYFKGVSIGAADKAKEYLNVKFDDTSKGAKAGVALYDEGYRVGYYHGYNDITPMYLGCEKGTAFDASKYDEDGWTKETVTKLPSLKALYIPLEDMALSSKASVFGNDGVAFNLDQINDHISGSALNVGTPKVNISRIDFIEGQLDADEAAMALADFAQTFYQGQKKIIENKYKSTCAVAESSITEATLGNNIFTDLSFITVCEDYGKENKWGLSKYGFMKLPGSKILMTSIQAAGDVKAAGVDDINDAKMPSKDFIRQLYSKIQVK